MLEETQFRKERQETKPSQVCIFLFWTSKVDLRRHLLDSFFKISQNISLNKPTSPMPAQLLFLQSLSTCYRVYQQASRIVYIILQDAMKFLQVQTCSGFPIQFINLSGIFFLLLHFTNSYIKSYYSSHLLVIELVHLKNYVLLGVIVVCLERFCFYDEW